MLSKVNAWLFNRLSLTRVLPKKSKIKKINLIIIFFHLIVPLYIFVQTWSGIRNFIPYHGSYRLNSNNILINQFYVHLNCPMPIAACPSRWFYPCWIDKVNNNADGTGGPILIFITYAISFVLLYLHMFYNHLSNFFIYTIYISLYLHFVFRYMNMSSL